MSIEQKINNDTGVLILGDEIDLDQSPIVREKIKDLFEKCKTVSVDLANVSYIDSSGIAALVEGMQTGKKEQKNFTLINVSNEVMKVIKLAHLDKMFKIESESHADANPNVGKPSEETAPQGVSSDNIDITQEKSEEIKSETSEDESVKPQVDRDESGDDKIKFKR